MPKFVVSMNYIEAKSASFIIEAKNEDDVYDAIGEIDNDFFENHDNVKWVCSGYEPPIIDFVYQVKKNKLKNKRATTCTIKQQKAIQKQFDSVIEHFNQTEANNG